MVKLRAVEAGDEVDVKVEDKGDGTYVGTYTIDANAPVAYQLSVLLQGSHIQGSPFHVRVKPFDLFDEKQKSAGLAVRNGGMIVHYPGRPEEGVAAVEKWCWGRNGCVAATGNSTSTNSHPVGGCALVC